MTCLKGVYILLIRINRDVLVKVGSIGEIYFCKGFYAYVGSAQRCLDKRLARHLKKRKRNFWHVDYLLSDESVSLVNFFVKTNAAKSEECSIAKKLGEIGFPIKNFGCSDCDCNSHLFRINVALFENLCASLGFKPYSLASESP